MENQIMNTEELISFEVVQDDTGKFTRKAVYKPFSSVKAETKEQKIKMVNLLDGDAEEALPMNEHVGAEFDIRDVILKPYDSVDEKTGATNYGVLTYIFDSNNDVYVTSSKSVYHTLNNLFQVFGLPHYSEDEALKVKIVKKDGANHKYVDIKVIG